MSKVRFSSEYNKIGKFDEPKKKTYTKNMIIFVLADILNVIRLRDGAEEDI